MATKKRTAKKPATRKPTTKKPVAKKKPATKRRTAQPVQQTVVVKEKSKSKFLKFIKVIVILFLVFVVLGVVVLGGTWLSGSFHNLTNNLTGFSNNIKDWFNIESETEIVLDDLWHNFDDNPTASDLPSEKVEEIINSPSTPTMPDVIRNYEVVELDNYVIVFRESTMSNGTVKYPNMLFLKTDKGLIWDGMVGVTAHVPLEYWGIVPIGAVTGKHDYSKAKVTIDMNFESSFLTKDSGDWWRWLAIPITGIANVGSYMPQDNYVTFSDFRADFAHNFWKNVNLVTYLSTQNRELNYLHNWIKNYLYENVVKLYFRDLTDQLGDGTILALNRGTNEKNLELLNGVNNFIFENSKTADKTNNNVVLPLNHYFTYNIPTALQSNYPVPAELQESMGNYYTIYAANIMSNVNYQYLGTKIDRDNKVSQESVKDVHVEPAPTSPTTNNWALVRFQITNTQNFDLSNITFSNNPLMLRINGRNYALRELKNNSFSIEFSLQKNTAYEYTLTHPLLEFNSTELLEVGSSTKINYSVDITSVKAFHYNFSKKGVLANDGYGSIELDFFQIILGFLDESMLQNFTRHIETIDLVVYVNGNVVDFDYVHQSGSNLFGISFIGEGEVKEILGEQVINEVIFSGFGFDLKSVANPNDAIYFELKINDQLFTTSVLYNFEIGMSMHLIYLIY